MSRLHELIEQAKASNPELGNALAEEVQRLEDRPAFGLVFERHAPEATELYGRPITQGDKVHVLNERGSTAKADQTLWRVEDIYEGDATRAHLVETLPGNQEWDTQAIGREPRKETALVENLVVVAEHKDTIYPGLFETGRVSNGPEDAPAHTIINAENLHALQALTYTHHHAIDCIYIDPPYNTGAKDWKYNNDYVEADDDYRHSKWLSFMEKRLLLAKELLNPADSVLIVTIDEKEYLRLGLLLQQTFPESRIQMVSTVISSKGSARKDALYRVDEYVFLVMTGAARPALVERPGLHIVPKNEEKKSDRSKVNWESLMRRGSASYREDRPGMFYPIYVDPESRKIIEIGSPVPDGVSHSEVETPRGLAVAWPLRTNGREGRWMAGPDSLRDWLKSGFVKVSSVSGDRAKVSYLPEGKRELIAKGEIRFVGEDSYGYPIYKFAEPEAERGRVKTQWNVASHNASEYGTSLVNALVPNQNFVFPKSLYAVEDAVLIFTKDKPNATILDFFAGSGTTAHAVMRLNKQDGGKRRSIMVTNNEVSAEEQKSLREKGLRPGDTEWEALGIADYVTKPRVTAAITGKTTEGDPIKGDYRFTDEFPMSDGFEANARYFSLEYLNPVMVEFGYAFSRIAPLLWMRAGQVGPVIEVLPDRGWEVTDFYAVLENCDDALAFTEAVKRRPGITHVYIITDNVSVYRRVARSFDDSIQTIQLYESYLTNFAINASRVLK